MTLFQRSLHKYIVQYQLNQRRNISRCWCLLQQRKNEENHFNNSAALQKSTDKNSLPSSKVVREKIKENTKTASYTAIIIAGVGVTAVMFFAIFRELFSSFSPNNVYSEALERVVKDPQVQDSLGAPIKGFGEESRRRRRQHVAHAVYERSGVPHMRMHFYIQGIRNKATVHLEAKQGPSGIEYRYLFVQLDYYPHTTIILEDNRSSDKKNMEMQPTQQTEWNKAHLELASFSKKS